MTQDRAKVLLDRINEIRNDTQTRQDGDCRTEVYNLCEIVGELLCELRNVEDMAVRAHHSTADVWLALKDILPQN